MPRPQVSVVKRQREQAKRERQQNKAERRAQRKSAKLNGEVDDPMAEETVVAAEVE